MIERWRRLPAVDPVALREDIDELLGLGRFERRVDSGIERGILDTSTLVILGQLPDAHALPAEPMITAVTLAELTVGPLVAREDDERSRRQAHLQQAEADFVALPFDAEAARAFGAVATSLRRAGRKAAARSLRRDDRGDRDRQRSAALHL